MVVMADAPGNLSIRAGYTKLDRSRAAGAAMRRGRLRSVLPLAGHESAGFA
jgi:hypothetical protein